MRIKHLITAKRFLSDCKNIFISTTLFDFLWNLKGQTLSEKFQLPERDVREMKSLEFLFCFKEYCSLYFGFNAAEMTHE